MKFPANHESRRCIKMCTESTTGRFSEPNKRSQNRHITKLLFPFSYLSLLDSVILLVSFIPSLFLFGDIIRCSVVKQEIKQNTKYWTRVSLYAVDEEFRSCEIVLQKFC